MPTKSMKNRGPKFHNPNEGGEKPDREIRKNINKLRPKKGDGVSEVTISTNRKSVTLTADGVTTEGFDPQTQVVDAVKEIHSDATAHVRRKAPAPAPAAPAHLVIRVPTDIGLACATEPSRYAIGDVAVMRSPESPGLVLLAATDGRMLAVVTAAIEEEGDCVAAELVPRWIPKRFARIKKGARPLRLAHGAKTSLFSSTRTWVDDEGGEFESHPEGGMFPRAFDAMPRSTDGGRVVRLNVGMLLALARALNSHEADSRDSLTLVVQEDPNKPVMVLGNVGIGVVMPIKCAPALVAEEWHRARQTFATASLNAPNVGVPEQPGDHTGGTGEEETLMGGDQSPPADAPMPGERAETGRGVE